MVPTIQTISARVPKTSLFLPSFKRVKTIINTVITNTHIILLPKYNSFNKISQAWI